MINFNLKALFSKEASPAANADGAIFMVDLTESLYASTNTETVYKVNFLIRGNANGDIIKVESCKDPTAPAPAVDCTAKTHYTNAVGSVTVTTATNAVTITLKIKKATTAGYFDIDINGTVNSFFK